MEDRRTGGLADRSGVRMDEAIKDRRAIRCGGSRISSGSDIDVLMEFLGMPLSDSEAVFEKFALIDGHVDRGSEPKRFLYIPGKREKCVLLVAHADTYWWKGYAREICHEHVIVAGSGILRSGTPGFGLGADDRAGCAILWLLQDFGHSILITSGEEQGQKASNWLLDDPQNADIASEINERHLFVLQLDRRGGSDYRCYDIGTDEFKRYVEEKTGFLEYVFPKGKTDIKVLCRSVPGANISIGYSGEHHDYEELNLQQWRNTLAICRKWLSEEDLPAFRRVCSNRL